MKQANEEENALAAMIKAREDRRKTQKAIMAVCQKGKASYFLRLLS